MCCASFEKLRWNENKVWASAMPCNIYFPRKSGPDEVPSKYLSSIPLGSRSTICILVKLFGNAGGRRDRLIIDDENIL